MNLITARYSQVDPIHYSTILGGGQANAGQLESAIKKSVDTITSNCIGTSSWLQAFVEGETCWSDYQVIINNLHRMSKLLKLIPEGETPQNRALRLTRREAYKKALRAHQEHVRLGVEAEIQTAEDALEDLSTKDGVTQVELQGARDELASLREAEPAEVEDEFDDAVNKGESTQTELQAMQDRIQNLMEYEGGLTATNDGLRRNLAEVPAVEPYYSQMANNAKCTFWEARWSQDVFLSFLCEFQGVMHYK
ncbi:hypothetical protein J4E93_010982 [Alternaria ventricosa]|uniref:uncharacterized protein n=1 Tax=Alternaria ventricosa TaxID=1187951 RepID=UPI0020C29B07|nr:uncharacterized protein J4E93_010982 [Alternaria ventricosa]KAI4636757.1 hypothetical protein J4E93_010982 [Alternaria ventricosa]